MVSGIPKCNRGLNKMLITFTCADELLLNHRFIYPQKYEKFLVPIIHSFKYIV